MASEFGCKQFTWLGWAIGNIAWWFWGTCRCHTQIENDDWIQFDWLISFFFSFSFWNDDDKTDNKMNLRMCMRACVFFDKSISKISSMLSYRSVRMQTVILDWVKNNNMRLVIVQWHCWVDWEILNTCRFLHRIWLIIGHNWVKASDWRWMKDKQ